MYDVSCPQDENKSTKTQAPPTLLATLPFLCCGPGPGSCPGRICLGPCPLFTPIPLGLLLAAPLPPAGPSKPALNGVPPTKPAFGKLSVVALFGVPIMLNVRLRPDKPSEGVVALYIEFAVAGGAPSAERNMSFMRMF